jgi:SRSO17 transposase
MNLDQGGDSETRFAEYVAGLGSVIGHAERPLRDYCTGLMLPGERKSVEPMAARTAPARTSAQASIAASFCRRRRLVGRGRTGQGPRDGAAGDQEQRTDRGVDH